MCLHKPDTPTPETTLVFIAEFVSFFPCSKLFINPLLLCYIFSQLLACCINTICLLLFYLHHYLFFLKVPFTPHPVPQFLCCSHYQASYLLTPCSWPLPQLSSLLVSHSSLSFSVFPLAPWQGCPNFPLTQTSSHEQKNTYRSSRAQDMCSKSLMHIN